jgi:hypothetical protein
MFMTRVFPEMLVTVPFIQMMLPVVAPCDTSPPVRQTVRAVPGTIADLKAAIEGMLSVRRVNVFEPVPTVTAVSERATTRPAPAPLSLIALPLMEIGLFHVHVPAGIVTVAPETALLMAVWTSVCEQVAADVPPVETDAANEAVTVIFDESVTVQEPVPEQAPDQPENVEPEDGVAVRVTAVPLFTVIEQVVPQLMDPPEEATVPEPVPDFVTVRV